MMLDKDCHHDCNQNQCPFAQDTRNPNIGLVFDF